MHCGKGGSRNDLSFFACVHRSTSVDTGNHIKNFFELYKVLKNYRKVWGLNP